MRLVVTALGSKVLPYCSVKYMGSASGVKSCIAPTDVLWEVILDTRVISVKTVQNHNPLVDMTTFGKLLYAILVSCACMMIWEAGGLEFATYTPFILSCWEVNTSWPLVSQLGQVPYTVLLSMWSYSSDEDILPQEHSVKKTSPHSACLGVFCPFQVELRLLLPLPMNRAEGCLEMLWSYFLHYGFHLGGKKKISFSWKHRKPPELTDLIAQVSAWRMLGADGLC